MKAEVMFGGDLGESYRGRGQTQIAKMVGRGKPQIIGRLLEKIELSIPMFFVLEIEHTEDEAKKKYKVSGSRLRIANWLSDAKLTDPKVEIVHVTSDRNVARGMAQEV